MGKSCINKEAFELKFEFYNTKNIYKKITEVTMASNTEPPITAEPMELPATVTPVIAEPTMTVFVKCALPDGVCCVILGVSIESTFRDIRKMVEDRFNGDGCVLLMNSNIMNGTQKLIDAEFQKYDAIIAINALEHARALERHLNM